MRKNRASAAYGILYIAFALIALFLPHTTDAYFSSDAAAEENIFGAGTLEIDTDPDTLAATLMESGAVTTALEIESAGSIDPQFEVTAESNGCSGAFYNGIDVEAKQGSVVYTGSLATLLATSTSEGTWEFAFSASSSLMAYENDTCDVVLKIKAWQQEFPSSTIGGFSDEQEVALQITAGEDINLGVVLNEILPNPEGSDAQGGLQGEWVEVYNNGSTPVDLTGWYIEDLAGHRIYFASSTTMNGRTTIDVPGSGLEWVVLFMNGEVLNNDSDETVSLYDNTGIVQDQYSYAAGTNENDTDSDSNHTGGGDNDNAAGSETEKQEGKSDARIPDGIGAWIDPEPTAGEPNFADEETLRALGYSEDQIAFMQAQQERARKRFEAREEALRIEMEANAKAEAAAEVPEVAPTTETGVPAEEEKTETPKDKAMEGTDDPILAPNSPEMLPEELPEAKLPQEEDQNEEQSGDTPENKKEDTPPEEPGEKTEPTKQPENALPSNDTAHNASDTTTQ